MSLLNKADKNLTTLNYSIELQRLAASVGFDWPDVQGVIDKVHEEADEVRAETGIANNQQRLLDEMGDLLFACTNLARHLDIDPQQALNQASDKFSIRFKLVEQLVVQQHLTLQNCSIDQLEQLWQQAKQQQAKNT